MLKDITIGQYFPGDSPVHKMDARFKIGITAVFIIMLFAADGFLPLCLAMLFFVLAFAASGLSPKLILRSMKPIVPVILFTCDGGQNFRSADNRQRAYYLGVYDRAAHCAYLRVIAAHLHHIAHCADRRYRTAVKAS